MQNSLSTPVYVPVYFAALGRTIEITLRFFDRLLHAFLLKCEDGKWIAD